MYLFTDLYKFNEIKLSKHTGILAFFMKLTVSKIKIHT